MSNLLLIGKLRKQRDIDRNNARENGLRINHDYQVGDKVLITNNDIHRKLNCPTKGPFIIVQTYTNGTVRVKNGARVVPLAIKLNTCYYINVDWFNFFISIFLYKPFSEPMYRWYIGALQ